MSKLLASTILAITLVATAPGSGVAAEAFIRIRATSEVPDKIVEYIAHVSQPARLQLPAGETPEKFIRATCGAYTVVFEKIFLSYQGDEFVRKATEKPRQVNMPACIYWRRKLDNGELGIPVKVRPGDSISTLLEREIGPRTEADVRLRCALNMSFARCNKTYRELVQQLNPGRDLNALRTGDWVLLPIVTQPIVFKLNPSFTDKAKEVVETIRQFARAENFDIDVKEAPGVRLFGAIAPYDLAGDEPFCTSSGGKPWPYDPATVDMALTRTLEVMRKKKRDPAKIIVTVIDNGLDDTQLAPELLFADDSVGNPGGLYGMGATLPKHTRPFPNDSAPWHGTAIADILTGGSGLRAQSMGLLSRLLAINTFNLIKPDLDGVQIEAGGIERGVRFAADSGALVANISVGSDDQLTSLVDVLAHAPKLILVVAAGNEKRDLGNEPVYPAAYGGRNYQVITVAAHNRKPEFAASFSNYSNEYADVVAPGCDIPHGIQTGGIPSHGTSFAAPLVSMTVSFLRAFHVPAEEIKTRLRASVDVDLSLSERVVSAKGLASGRLNIAKTLAIYDDVLERRSEPGHLVFGKLQSGTGSIQICESGLWPNIDSIKKIINLDKNPPYKIRVLYLDSQKALQIEECKKPAQKLEAGLTFYDSVAGSTALVPWADFLDIVTRSRREDDQPGGGGSGGKPARRN